MAKKILVVGANGKMGSMVCEVLKNYCEIIKFAKGDKMDKFGADLVIDFGSAESSVLSAEYCLKNRVSLIVGSTGQSESELQKIRQVAKVAPFMICSNFSIGVAILKKCIKKILQVDVSDICIFEKHHKHKKDSPSGTSLEIEKVVRERLGISPEMLSLRGGCEVGTHSVSLYFGDECIEISHKAFSRRAFAKGVILAVKKIKNIDKTGLYSFEDIMNI